MICVIKRRKGVIMSIVKYSYFESTLNSVLFENSYKELIEKIAVSPERYVGIFRPTRAETKLIQNITQSHEIRFGDAMEIIFQKYFEASGFSYLARKLSDAKGDLDIDQIFAKDKSLYMIEQKMRDDHDSTKKVGQFDNFVRKYMAVSKKYQTFNICPIMWFIDDSLVKNRNYYLSCMSDFESKFQCTPYLFYGGEMFGKSGIKNFDTEIWYEVLDYLSKWKQSLPTMPEVNFDVNPEKVFDEIKDISIKTYKKLFNNKDVVCQIIPIISPTKKITTMLYKHFLSLYESTKNHDYRTLCDMLLVLDIVNIRS